MNFKTHILKTVNPSFTQILTGEKTFDIRKDDPARNFQVGDRLELCEYVPMGLLNELMPTGQSVNHEVICIVRGPEYGFPEGWVVMGLGPCRGRTCTPYIPNFISQNNG